MASEGGTPGAAAPATVDELLGGYARAARTAIADLRIDLGAVHDARVALRRLRATLDVFGIALPDVPERLGDEVRWLSRRVAATRDVDVVAERLAEPLQTAGDRVAAEILAGHLAAWTARARLAAVRAISGTRTESLLTSLERLQPAAPGPCVERDLSQRLAVPAIEALRDGFVGVEQPRSGVSRRRWSARLHELRKEAKTVRAILPVLDTTPDARAGLDKALRQAQDLLGEHHDAVVARSWLAGMAREDPRLGGLVREVRTAERAVLVKLERRVPGAAERLVGAVDAALGRAGS